jgi:hypothetical protein
LDLIFNFTIILKVSDLTSLWQKKGTLIFNIQFMIAWDPSGLIFRNYLLSEWPSAISKRSPEFCFMCAREQFFQVLHSSLQAPGLLAWVSVTCGVAAPVDMDDLCRTSPLSALLHRGCGHNAPCYSIWRRYMIFPNCSWYDED